MVEGMTQLPAPRDWPIPETMGTDRGYRYFCDKRHPLASKASKVWMHRHQASVKLERWVTPEEHVHHLNGDRGDNAHSNLVVLTSSEHALLHHPYAAGAPPNLRPCASCGKIFTPAHERIKACSHTCARECTRKLTISKEELEKLVWAIPSSRIAAQLGVSDTAIAKRCRVLGVRKPPKGYWARVNSDGTVRPVKPRPMPMKHWEHGSITGYTNYKCRCALCVKARSDYEKSYRIRVSSNAKTTAFHAVDPG